MSEPMLSIKEGIKAGVLVRPRSTDEVSRAMQICHA